MQLDVAQLNANIRAELARAGLSQSALAASLGMHQTAVSRRLTGTRDWTLSEALAVATLLGLSLDDLLGITSKAAS